MPRLEVRDFSVGVRLGCTPGERQVPQEVRFSADLIFAAPPRACGTDRLEDTACYARACEAIRDVATQAEYATVERLGAAALAALRQALDLQAPGSGISIRLRVHKVRPPIDGLLGGVIFELGDL
jgi:dihydroneopterin aldolase